MLRANMRWQLATYDETRADEIARELGISPVVARLLAIRGVDTPERAQAFLHVDEEQFYDPFLLDGMEPSVHRIRRAIERGEPICLYGDYDADGVTATSLMIRLMRQMGATFDYYIPNRFTEGYGLNQDALRHISESGFKLVVTVDTGISAAEQVAFGRELGLDIIVTDHHEPPEQIPEAFAVINPKKPGCPYPFDMLAGVGVAFKLAHALLGEPPMHLADLAAIGTIADLVPLVDENRVLAKLGLKRLNHTRHVGLKALIQVAGLADAAEITAGHVGFAIGPRINAGGRLETAEAAVKLLTTDDPVEADELAGTLDRLNRERQELVQAIAEEAQAIVAAECPPKTHRVLVVAREGWNVGVVGIVASRLVETFYRPAIVLSIDPEKGTAKGSARSIAGFDMYEALTACADLLPHYGGHTMAAGMTLPVENVPLLRERLNALAAEWLTEEDFTPLTRVDLAVGLDEVTLELAAQLEELAPFGLGNPTPLLLLKDVEWQGVRRIGRDETHLKCAVIDGASRQVDAVGFGLAHITEHVAPKAKLQMIGELSVNEWNGQRKPQLLIRDVAVLHRQVFDWRGVRDKEARWRTLMETGRAVTIAFREETYEELAARAFEFPVDRRPPVLLVRPDGSFGDPSLKDLSAYPVCILYDLPRTRAALECVALRTERAERIYCLFGDPDLRAEPLSVPGRDRFKALYQVLCARPELSRQHLDALARRLQMKRERLEWMLAVFAELGLVQVQPERYVLAQSPSKTSLEASALYRQAREEAELATELLLSPYETLIRHLNQRVASSTP